MRKDIAMKYNRRIFPGFKGLGWDPLFYSSIIFLFLSEIKGIDASQILYASSLLSVFALLFQIPATILMERIGSRKSLIIGCLLITLQIALMLVSNNFAILVFAYSLSAFGDAIKASAQDILLYDCTKVCKGKNSFGNIDAKGSAISYIFGAISSVFAGYLFVINPYIPIVLSTIFSAITIFIAYSFEDVRISDCQKATISGLIKDTKDGFVFIFKSKRLRSFFVFMTFFVGVLMLFSTYESSLLKDLKIEPQYFGIIFAILTLAQCFSVRYQGKIHNRFKNKTLTFLSVPVFLSFILIGIVTSLNLHKSIVIIAVILIFFLLHCLRAPYWVLQNNYITNFTNSEIRPKIFAARALAERIGRIIITFISGLLLEYYNTGTSYFILGISGLIIIILILLYMKPRFGLSPEKYDEKDIQFKSNLYT